MRARTVMACLAALAAGTTALLQPALAQTVTRPPVAGCTGEQVSTVIDETGARLRQQNAESQPRLRAKLREVAQARGWTDVDLQDKGVALLQDDETQNLDDQAGQLLMRLDQLGDETRAKGSVCTRLEDARVAAAQLIEVTSQRSTHVLARLEAALRPTAATVTGALQAPQAPPPAMSESRAGKTATPQVAIAPDASAPPPKTPPPKALATPAWNTETVRAVEPSPAVMAELPRPVDPAATSFSPDDIRAAGRGVFGSISAGLASVIDFAFTTYGRPTGYIIGQEGGGAFLAGLRYGEGKLVTKLGGEHKIYWQGPSIGYDFGAAGSQVMILVYSVDKPEQLHTRFAGVDGSAYLVGGAGITFMKKGPIVLAPIRTGLGLRVGANIGYLKFTPEASLNPF